MKDRLVERRGRRSTSSRSSCRPGVLRIRARDSAVHPSGGSDDDRRKFSDAAQVHSSTGACPTLALHVQWDLPNGLKDVGEVERLSQKFGVRPGSINPNIFQNQEYKYGSLGNPDPAIRKTALRHILDCVGIAEALHCRDVAPWFADGSNYPGTQNMRQRIAYFEEGLREIHRSLKSGQRLLIEYKPFEPAFLSHGHCGLGHGLSAGERGGAASVCAG